MRTLVGISSRSNSPIISATLASDLAALLPEQLSGLAAAIFKAAPAASLAAMSAQTPPYLGQVATRATIPSAGTNAFKQSMARSRHIARDDITSLKLVYGNWFALYNGTGENGTGAALNVTASIEYPIGVLTQVLFNGIATASIADLTNRESDFVSINIPRGAVFYVRTWQSSPVGVLYNAQQLGDVANGETFNFGATVPDQTMTVPILDIAGGASGMGPAAIVGLTRRPSVFIAGDSRLSAIGDVFDALSGDKGEAARSIGPLYGYVNVAIPSDSVEWATEALYANRLDLSKYCSHVVTDYGANDMAGGERTSAQLIEDYARFFALFGKKPIIQMTISPETTSTDGWATAANQSPTRWNADRIIVNNTIRAGMTGAFGYVDPADVVETSRNSGIWKSTGAAGGYTVDGRHETPAMYRMIQAEIAASLCNLIEASARQ